MGAGGGGGGSCRNDGTGVNKTGDGGDGGDGIVVVVTYMGVEGEINLPVEPDDTEHRTEATGPSLFIGSRIIKQVNEPRLTGGVIPINDDAELTFVSQPNTLYEVKFLTAMTGATGTINNARARIRCSAAVAHAAIRLTRIYVDIPHGWPSGAANIQHTFCYSTAQFNADDRNWSFSTGGAAAGQYVVGFGMIKTGGSGGTISIKWGSVGGGGSLTMLQGSWLSCREVQEI
jgi:hypothetical protein